jgi:hypothetical protein
LRLALGLLLIHNVDGVRRINLNKMEDASGDFLNPFKTTLDDIRLGQIDES